MLGAVGSLNDTVALAQSITGKSLNDHAAEFAAGYERRRVERQRKETIRVANTMSKICWRFCFNHNRPIGFHDHDIVECITDTFEFVVGYAGKLDWHGNRVMMARLVEPNSARPLLGTDTCMLHDGCVPRNGDGAAPTHLIDDEPSEQQGSSWFSRLIAWVLGR